MQRSLLCHCCVWYFDEVDRIIYYIACTPIYFRLPHQSWADRVYLNSHTTTVLVLSTSIFLKIEASLTYNILLVSGVQPYLYIIMKWLLQEVQLAPITIHSYNFFSYDWSCFKCCTCTGLFNSPNNPLRRVKGVNFPWWLIG